MIIRLVMFASLALNAMPSASQNLVLLLKREEQYIVQAVSGSTTTQIASLGYHPTYGESDSSFVFVSESVSGPTLLQVVDKTSKRVTGSWEINARPVPRVSGPSLGIITSGGYAYFASICYGPDRSTVAPNEAGGAFDFNRVSLTDGKHERYPLPVAVRDPRIANYNGVPLIYSWNGPNIWKFEIATDSLVQVVSQLDIEDTIVAPGDAPIPEDLPSRFTDYVVLPGAGVYRFSRFGVLSPVLNSDLSLLSSPDAGVAVKDVGVSGRVSKVFASSVNDKTYIGIMSAGTSHIEIRLVDPQSMRTAKEFSLPATAVAATTLVSRDGLVYFVDGEGGSVNQVSQEAATDLRVIVGEQSKAIHDARILSVDDTP